MQISFFPLTSCVLFIHPSLVLLGSLLCRKMSTGDFLALEKIWFDKPRYDEAERRFYERMNGSSQPSQVLRFNKSLNWYHLYD